MSRNHIGMSCPVCLLKLEMEGNFQSETLAPWLKPTKRRKEVPNLNYLGGTHSREKVGYLPKIGYRKSQP